MNFYQETPEKVLEELSTTENGLTHQEAGARLEQYGPNKLAEGKKVTLFQRFLQQLSDPMIIILLAAAAVSGITAAYSGESFADVFIILIVVLINAVLGVYQESKAEKAIEALQEMTAATSKVLRDGKLSLLHSDVLVPGDIVVLEAGDAVPADCRILESASIKAEEAALTGESVPVEKEVAAISSEEEVPLGDRRCMLYMGSTVVYGRGRAVVCSTGMDTEMGKIADALAQAQENETPLQRKLGQLSKILSVLVLGICVFIFLFSLLRAGDFHLDTIISTFMVAVSLAVAAIPEGLAAVVTIVLSIGVTNMSKRNAVIRRLTAVETLGCAQVICSDKTGTLTQNKMTVVDHFGDSQKTARAMSLCSDAAPDDTGNAVGEPTECALVNWATKEGLLKPDMEAETPRVGEAPFDSSRKMMSTIHKVGDGFVQYTKGAPDELLKRCTHSEKDGKILPLDESAKQEILAQNKAMADQALRVLAAAQRTYAQMPEDQSPAALEHDLTFLGLAGMIDPIRPEVRDAIGECKTAGIRVVMITGDHRDTAVAIAKQLGILEHDDQAITGAQLNQISDEELDKTIDHYSVYARVQPEHKVRIVNAWKKKGCITAMTGDGVNDAPSLKHADIGVAMGITGTDVSKEAADMILTDDNFASIVSAVAEGRTIYSNIRKVVGFLLSCNIGEILVIFIAMLANLPVPLVAIQLHSINLITDAFPAFALGMEKEEPGTMTRPPRDPQEPIVNKKMTVGVIIQSVALALGTLISFMYGYFVHQDLEIARSACFFTLVIGELLRAYSSRSETTSIFRMKILENSYLNKCVFVSILFMFASIYVPFLNPVFSTQPLAWDELLVALLFAFLPMLGGEAAKLIQKRL